MIKWLHIEQTSRCNASCTSCLRSDHGYGLAKGLLEADLSLTRLEEVIDQLPDLESVQYCGVRGDAIAAMNFIQSLDLVINKNISYIQIHTNGSLKTVEWWKNLAKKLKGIRHEVWFALDGLADTHKIYRQNTDYEKIIKNAAAFIEEGGSAVWQFIPFKHNQHQIKDVIKTSQRMKFKRIEIVKNARYTSYARHYKTGLAIDISPWDFQKNYDRHKGDAADKHQTTNNYVKTTDCMHLSYPSLFINYMGIVSACCYLPDDNVENLDIISDFKNKTWKKTCLKWCGSIK